MHKADGCYYTNGVASAALTYLRRMCCKTFRGSQKLQTVPDPTCTAHVFSCNAYSRLSFSLPLEGRILKIPFALFSSPVLLLLREGALLNKICVLKLKHSHLMVVTLIAKVTTK